MTLGSIIQSSVGPSGSQYYDHYPASGESQSFISERDGTSYGPPKKAKSKSKSSEKKHAAMSALTLLAFLFFLNILQNCLKEQENNNATVMMVMPATGASQAKIQGEEPMELIKKIDKVKRGAEFFNPDENVQMNDFEETNWGENIRKSRTLLQTHDEDDSSERNSKVNRNRQTKFIQDYRDVDGNWASELSQLSKKELENQKIKTDSFNLFWKDNKLISSNENQKLKLETLPKITINKLIKSPILSDIKEVPKIRKYKNKEKATTESNGIKSVEFETEKARTKIADFQDFVINVPNEPTTEETTEPQVETTTKQIEMENVSDHIRNYIVRNQDQPKRTSHNFYKKERPKKYKTPKESDDSVKLEDYPANVNLRSDPIGPVGTPSIFQEQNGIINTPRSRRSDFLSTTSETNNNSNEVQSATPVQGLDLNTYKTYPVYANPTQYYNHRYGSQVLRENKTVEIVTPETTGKPEITELKQDPSEIIQITTEAPYYPVPTTKAYSKYPYYDKMKNRNRYPNHQKYYPAKSRYPSEYKYHYNPYRKQALYDPGYYLRDEYYPMSVVGKYPGPNEEEVGFNLIKFVWTMLTAFARPLARLVPSFGKVTNAEPQCYDLLVCEAHRVSKFVGPTAEALASTFSTVLTWVTTEEYKQSVMEAVSSGKENSCQQQIQDCDERSGGKSAMTMIAQIMEMKLR